ncbi:MAG TPA: hypothetical protein VLH60_07115 [Sedimentisphaerales bacterium]|nr:hypothetical protein [Sedimentisphaerales bacterium]
MENLKEYRGRTSIGGFMVQEFIEQNRTLLHRLGIAARVAAVVLAVYGGCAVAQGGRVT